jgi:predicted flap endonuclease-1-like 5' DNA nuclease
MPQIADVEGIGPVFAEKLAAAGVRTTDALLERAAKSSGRRELAQATGLQERQLLEWVNRVDLARVNGVGSEYADLLEAAGVDSPTELAHRVPANLQAALQSTNDAKHLVRRVPTLAEVERWVAEAKTMPKVVEH